MAPAAPVTICLPTHNRLADLTHTLTELRRLQPQPDEILVLADGCTDATEESVRRDYPEVRLLTTPAAVGCVEGRNILFQAASHEIILSLDDDSYPLEDDFIARLRQLFTENQRLAVASFPQRTDEFPESLTRTDFGPSYFSGSYVNCACALRRSVFTDLGGYPAFFFHSYDEPDFSLRCLAAGWEIRFETIGTVRHHFSPVLRNERRTHQRHARNECWSVLMRCPLPQWPLVALFRLTRQFGYAWKRGLAWCWQEPRWWLAALGGAGHCLARRQPIPWRIYLAWMRLMRTPLFDRAEWRRSLGQPPVAP